MSTLAELDALVEHVKRLPAVERDRAVELLREVISEPYQLSADELVALLPALEEARAGRGLSDAETDPLLNLPWQ